MRKTVTVLARNVKGEEWDIIAAVINIYLSLLLCAESFQGESKIIVVFDKKQSEVLSFL